MDDWCGVLGRLCGGQGDTVTCYLCLDEVINTTWNSGEHRKQCANRNISQLSAFTVHPSVACLKCSGKLRLWPQQGPTFSCDSGHATCPANGKLMPSTGDNRYNCFPCDFDLCKTCISTVGEERQASTSNSNTAQTKIIQAKPSTVSADAAAISSSRESRKEKSDANGQAKQNGVASVHEEGKAEVAAVGEDLGKDGPCVNGDENQNTKEAVRASLVLSASVDADDNIPLIDLQSSSEDLPDLVNAANQPSKTNRPIKKPSVLEERSRSVASLGVTMPDVGCSTTATTPVSLTSSCGNAHLPSPANFNSIGNRKALMCGTVDSPDIFNLRAPLVSCENFLTPATSREAINLADSKEV